MTATPIDLARLLDKRNELLLHRILGIARLLSHQDSVLPVRLMSKTRLLQQSAKKRNRRSKPVTRLQIAERNRLTATIISTEPRTGVMRQPVVQLHPRQPPRIMNLYAV